MPTFDYSSASESVFNGIESDGFADDAVLVPRR